MKQEGEGMRLQHLTRRIRALCLCCFGLASLFAASPAALTGIERTGMPPYEGQEIKLYLLAGEGCTPSRKAGGLNSGVRKTAFTSRNLSLRKREITTPSES